MNTVLCTSLLCSLTHCTTGTPAKFQKQNSSTTKIEQILPMLRQKCTIYAYYLGILPVWRNIYSPRHCANAHQWYHHVDQHCHARAARFISPLVSRPFRSSVVEFRWLSQRDTTNARRELGEQNRVDVRLVLWGESWMKIISLCLCVHCINLHSQIRKLTQDAQVETTATGGSADGKSTVTPTKSAHPHWMDGPRLLYLVKRMHFCNLTQCSAPCKSFLI